MEHRGRALAKLRAIYRFVRYLLGMTAGRLIRNLALIGFMGTGKSSVGRLAADALGFTFLDTDRVIEARAGMPITEIFAQQGEPAFRDWERRIVAELEQRENTVIATGGGLPAIEGNLASLKRHAIVICLWATPEIILERVAAHTHRPLLNDPDPLAKIRKLLAAREPFYREADVLISTDRRSPRDVATHVIHQFHAALPVQP